MLSEEAEVGFHKFTNAFTNEGEVFLSCGQKFLGFSLLLPCSHVLCFFLHKTEGLEVFLGSFLFRIACRGFLTEVSWFTC